MALLKKAIESLDSYKIKRYWNNLSRKKKGQLKASILNLVQCSKVPFYNAFKTLDKLKDLHSLIEFDILYILNELATTGQSKILKDA